MSKKYSAFLLIWVSIIKYFVTKSNVQTHYNVKSWMEFTVCKFCIKVIMESYSCFPGSILLLLHLPLAPPCTTSAVVCLCMLDETVASCGTASSTFNLKPFQSVMCLLWNIYKKLYPGFWLHLHEVNHGTAQIMLSCLWKKSTQLDVPLQDSL